MLNCGEEKTVQPDHKKPKLTPQERLEKTTKILDSCEKKLLKNLKQQRSIYKKATEYMNTLSK